MSNETNETVFTKQDFVTATAIELESIPAGSNPLHYDLGHMCSELVRGWVIMHPGFGDHEQKIPLNYMILVNTVSGQRIKINLTKKE